MKIFTIQGKKFAKTYRGKGKKNSKKAQEYHEEGSRRKLYKKRTAACFFWPQQDVRMLTHSGHLVRLAAEEAAS